ncbi:MAG: hypothetical protein AB1938_31130 [Myxococcota bacterium]
MARAAPRLRRTPLVPRLASRKARASVLFAASALLWAGLDALAQPSLVAAHTAAPRPVATVNGVPITFDDFVRRLRESRRLLPAGSAEVGRAFGFPEIALRDLVDTELLVQASQAHGDSPSEEQIQRWLEANARGHQSGAGRDAARRAVMAELALERVRTGAMASEQELLAECRRRTDLATLVCVRFSPDDFRESVPPPTAAALAAWTRAHQAQLDAALSRRAKVVLKGEWQGEPEYLEVIDGQRPPVTDELLVILKFALAGRPPGEYRVVKVDGGWRAGTEEEVRRLLALEGMLDAQSEALARRAAERAHALASQGKRLSALFPDLAIRSGQLNALSGLHELTWSCSFELDESNRQLVFGRTRPGPVALVQDGRDLEVVAVETRTPLRPAECTRQRQALEAAVLEKNRKALEIAYLARLRQRASIHVDRLAVDDAAYLVFDSPDR